MKPTIRALALGGVLAALAAGTASAQTVLNFSNWLPPTHRLLTDVLEPWAEAVETETEGRVKVVFPPKVVGSVPAQYDVVVDGLADAALFVPGYTPGRFDVVGMGELPLTTDDPTAGALGFQWLYDQHLAKIGVFRDVHVVSMFTTAAGHIAWVGDPITRMAQMKNLKFRSPLPTTSALLEQMGAIPISKPVTELYELLSTGVLDGSLSGFDQAAGGFRLAEIVGGYTEIPGGLYNSVLGVVMNKATWESRSEADRAAIDRVSGDWIARRVGAAYDKYIVDGREALKAQGKTIVVADDAFVGEIREAAKPLVARMVEVAKEAGMDDPEAVMAAYRDKLAEFEAASAK